MDTRHARLTAGQPGGRSSFQLSLHLPYYAWRVSPGPRLDSRLDSSGKPLRHVRDVSILDFEGRSSFLYEAQISCVISGFDERRWVAYGFVDSYFDGEDGENARNCDGQDPFGYAYAATGDPPNPPESARDFFLYVLEIRAKQIGQEWEMVFNNVHKGFRKYAKVRALSLFLVKKSTTVC